MPRLKTFIAQHWFEILLASVTMAIYLYAALSEAHNFPVRWYTRDDAYYYFKVAQNISEGKGITFDRINPTNGFHPLWMIVCIPIFALARLDLILPLRVLTLVLGAISSASAIVLYQLVRRVLSREVAMFAALYWALDLWLFKTVTQMGLETALTALTMLIFIDQIECFGRTPRDRTSWKDFARLGLLASLVLFSRLDTVYFVMIAGVWIVLKDHELRPLLIADLVIAATSMYLALILRMDMQGVFQYTTNTLLMIGMGFAFKATLLFFIGMYQRSPSIPATITRTLLANLIASALLLSVVLFLPGGFPRSAILIDTVICSVLMILARLAWLALAQNTRASYRPIEYFKSNFGNWLSRAAPYYTVTLGLLSVYMFYNILTLGTSSPVSGQIKRWWGSLEGNAYGGPVKSGLEFFGLDTTSSFQPWGIFTRFFADAGSNAFTILAALIIAIAIVSAAIITLDRKRAARAINQLGLIPLIAGGGFQILFYAGQGYAAMKEWYWVAQIIAVILADCILIDILLKKIRRTQFAPLAINLVVAAIGFGLVLGFGRYVIERMRYEKINAPYMDILPLLEANTQPGSLIGMTGGGNIGYYIKDRTIINMDGLINSPEYFRDMQTGDGGKYLEMMGLDYVFANPDILINTLPYSVQFKNYYFEPVNGIVYGNKKLMRFVPLKK